MRENFHESKERVGSGRTGQYSHMVGKKKQTENHLFFIINFHSSWVVDLARKNKEKLKYMENKPLELSHNYLDASRF